MTRRNSSKSSMPAWRVRVMPVSGAQQACAHEMLQAAVHSMYSRDGSGADVEVALRRRARSFFSGSFSGQSPQNFEPPALRSLRRVARALAGPDRRRRLSRRVSPRTRLPYGIGAAADHAAVAEQDHRAPRPGAGEAGGEVVQGHGRVRAATSFASASSCTRRAARSRTTRS